MTCWIKYATVADRGEEFQRSNCYRPAKKKILHLARVTVQERTQDASNMGLHLFISTRKHQNLLKVIFQIQTEISQSWSILFGNTFVLHTNIACSCNQSHLIMTMLMAAKFNTQVTIEVIWQTGYIANRSVSLVEINFFFCCCCFGIIATG